MSALSKKEIRQRVDALGPWFHNLDLDGVPTAPEHFLGDYPSVKWRRFSGVIPESLAGKTVLEQVGRAHHGPQADEEDHCHHRIRLDRVEVNRGDQLALLQELDICYRRGERRHLEYLDRAVGERG